MIENEAKELFQTRELKKKVVRSNACLRRKGDLKEKEEGNELNKNNSFVEIFVKDQEISILEKFSSFIVLGFFREAFEMTNTFLDFLENLDSNEKLEDVPLKEVFEMKVIIISMYKLTSNIFKDLIKKNHQKNIKIESRNDIFFILVNFKYNHSLINKFLNKKISANFNQIQSISLFLDEENVISAQSNVLRKKNRAPSVWNNFENENLVLKKKIVSFDEKWKIFCDFFDKSFEKVRFFLKRILFFLSLNKKILYFLLKHENFEEISQNLEMDIAKLHNSLFNEKKIEKIRVKKMMLFFLKEKVLKFSKKNFNFLENFLKIKKCLILSNCFDFDIRREIVALFFIQIQKIFKEDSIKSLFFENSKEKKYDFFESYFDFINFYFFNQKSTKRQLKYPEYFLKIHEIYFSFGMILIALNINEEENILKSLEFYKNLRFNQIQSISSVQFYPTFFMFEFRNVARIFFYFCVKNEIKNQNFLSNSKSVFHRNFYHKNTVMFQMMNQNDLLSIKNLIFIRFLLLSFPDFENHFEATKNFIFSLLNANFLPSDHSIESEMRIFMKSMLFFSKISLSECPKSLLPDFQLVISKLFPSDNDSKDSNQQFHFDQSLYYSDDSDSNVANFFNFIQNSSNSYSDFSLFQKSFFCVFPSSPTNSSFVSSLQCFPYETFFSFFGKNFEIFQISSQILNFFSFLEKFFKKFMEFEFFSTNLASPVQENQKNEETPFLKNPIFDSEEIKEEIKQEIKKEIKEEIPYKAQETEKAQAISELTRKEIPEKMQNNLIEEKKKKVLELVEKKLQKIEENIVESLQNSQKADPNFSVEEKPVTVGMVEEKNSSILKQGEQISPEEKEKKKKMEKTENVSVINLKNVDMDRIERIYGKTSFIEPLKKKKRKNLLEIEERDDSDFSESEISEEDLKNEKRKKKEHFSSSKKSLKVTKSQKTQPLKFFKVKLENSEKPRKKYTEDVKFFNIFEEERKKRPSSKQKKRISFLEEEFLSRRRSPPSPKKDQGVMMEEATKRDEYSSTLEMNKTKDSMSQTSDDENEKTLKENDKKIDDLEKTSSSLNSTNPMSKTQRKMNIEIVFLKKKK